MFTLRYQLRIKSKLLLLLLSTSVISVLIISFISTRKGEEIIHDVIYHELVGMRSAKAQQLRYYFDEMHSHVKILCQDPTIVGRWGQVHVGPIEEFIKIGQTVRVHFSRIIQIVLVHDGRGEFEPGL